MTEEIPISYQILSLSLQEEGAIAQFADDLPVDAVRELGNGHAEIFEALCDYHNRTGCDVVDPVAFRSWLEEETTIYDALGGSEGVKAYFDIANGVEKSTTSAVVGVLRHRYNKAMQLRYNEEIGAILNGEGDDEKLQELVAKIDQLSRSQTDPLKKTFDGNSIAERAESLWELPDFIPTPFPALNRAMSYNEDGGVCKGSVHAVIAPSGRGKSTLVRNFMNHWVEKGHRVLFVNFEEAQDIWERSLFTQITKQNVYLGKDVSDIQKKHYTKLFEDKMKEWGDRFVVNHDPDTNYFEDIEAWIRKVAQQKAGPPDVIIIDTIQSMSLKGNNKLVRWGQYEEMMIRLEKLAKDLHTAIIITSQENTNRMKEKREVVQQSDAGGSVAIIQKCAITIFITDAQLGLDDETQEESVVQLQIPKNRITGMSFTMDPPMLRYDDTTKSFMEYEMATADRYQPTAVSADDFAKGFA